MAKFSFEDIAFQGRADVRVIDKNFKKIEEKALTADSLPPMDYDPAGSAAAVQANLNDHTANTTAHITATERAAWNAAASNVLTFVYKCTGSADSTAIAAIINNFFSNGTAMAMKLIITGTMGIGYSSTYYAINIEATNTRGAICYLDFSDCHIPEITAASRTFIRISSSTARLNIDGLIVTTTGAGIYLGNSSNNIISNSKIKGNRTGIEINGTSNDNIVSNCVIAGGNGMSITGSSRGNTFSGGSISGETYGVYAESYFAGMVLFTAGCKIIGGTTGIQAETANTLAVIKLTDCVIAGTSTADIYQTTAASTMKWNIKGCSFSRASIYVNGTTVAVSTTAANANLSMQAYANLFSQAIS